MYEPTVQCPFPRVCSDSGISQTCDVACVGNLVADIFVDPVQRLPAPGELTITSGVGMSVGGSAANTAVALRVLGHEVDVYGRVGSDMKGDFVISDLRKRGIGVRHICRSADSSTSSTVVLNVRGEDRRYLHCIGANAEFGLEDLDFHSIYKAQVLYFGGYLALPSFNVWDLAKLIRESKARGLITVLDVTMPAGASFGIPDIAPILNYTDYFLPNFEEAERLTGETDKRSQAERLSNLNPDCVVAITCGPGGSLARYRGRLIETPGFRMESVDESGAGDAFAAGLITAILNGWDLEHALLFAAAVGASRTRVVGDSGGVFGFEEAVSFLERETRSVTRWDTSLKVASRRA